MHSHPVMWGTIVAFVAAPFVYAHKITSFRNRSVS